jgi:serine/threonine-protein kinase PknG
MKKCHVCGGKVSDGFCEDCGAPEQKQVLSVDGEVEREMASTSTTKRNSVRFSVHYPTRGATKKVGTQWTRRRSGDTSRTSSRRKSLGGGLVSLPDMPSKDPLTCIMQSPVVPEHKRHCPGCDAKVSREKGYCPSCGTEYDFRAHLKAGDMVADKYEVKGAMAFGGLGWIYLAYDVVLNRYVVLKGLLNIKDEHAAQVAVAERRFLAAVKHAKIVGIYDFVNHGPQGFIVMEYVGGRTIQSIRKEKGPLSPEEAISYILGILPAFEYMHGMGLVYCDFKPDNFMLEGDDVKLIDLGAVRKQDDKSGDLYATVGFAAPEAESDPSSVSDLYTIGRTLAIMLMDFRFASEFENSLPKPEDFEVLANNESLYRFLLRATHQDPDERFQDAKEMYDQLYGVLREIVSMKEGQPHPYQSTVFSGDRLVPTEDIAGVMSGQTLDFTKVLPQVKMNPNDMLASEIMSISASSAAKRLDDLNQIAVGSRGKAAKSVEWQSRMLEVYAMIRPEGIHKDKGFDADESFKKSKEDFESTHPFEWRINWFSGMFAMARRSYGQAKEEFEKVYFEMPGEVAPRLALGCAAEMNGEHDLALSYYDRVLTMDHSYWFAFFGKARCLWALERWEECLNMLMTVDNTSAFAAQCRLLAATWMSKLQINIDDWRAFVPKVFEYASKTTAQTTACKVVLASLLKQVIVVSKNGKSHTAFSFGSGENAMRAAAEKLLREGAKMSSDELLRTRLVEEANAIRPISMT